MVKDRQEFDQILLKFLSSGEEEKSWSAMAKMHDTFRLDEIARHFVQQVEKVHIDDSVYFSNLKQILNEKNFPLIKSWLLVVQARDMAYYLTPEASDLVQETSLKQYGARTTTSVKKQALALVEDSFSKSISHHYRQQHQSDQTDQAVSDMAEAIRQVHINRMKKNDWMSEQTKTAALEKLDKLKIVIGYHDQATLSENDLQVDETASPLENHFALNKAQLTYQRQHFSEKVDRGESLLLNYMVNAFYSPLGNMIYLPEDILNAPFFDSQAKKGTNYGALGSIIGHEMTHAFDPQGANYNADGKFGIWWRLEDYQAFQKKTYEFIYQWDELTLNGKQLQGKQYLQENIADAGGLSVALEAYGKADLAFFEGYAKTYAAKQTPENQEYLQRFDSHAPASLRVNQQLKNMDVFYEVYDIKKGMPCTYHQKNASLFGKKESETVVPD